MTQEDRRPTQGQSGSGALSARDEASCASVKAVLEAEIAKLPAGSQVRGQLDDWAQQLETNPPGFLPSTPQPSAAV